MQVHPSAVVSKLQVLKEQMQVDFIDINMGCPIDLVYKKGQGSALMNRLSKLEQVTTSLGLGDQICGGAGADITDKYRLQRNPATTHFRGPVHFLLCCHRYLANM